MSEHETIEEVQSPNVAKQDVDNDEKSSGGTLEENDSLPAKNNDKCTEVIDCSKAPDEEGAQSRLAIETVEPQGQTPVEEEAKLTENCLTNTPLGTASLPKESSKEPENITPSSPNFDESSKKDYEHPAKAEIKLTSTAIDNTPTNTTESSKSLSVITTSDNDEPSSEHPAKAENKLTLAASDNSSKKVTESSEKLSIITTSGNDEPPSENSANETISTAPKENVIARSPSVDVCAGNDQNVFLKPDTQKETSCESEASQTKDDYAEHVTYASDGTAIYTDPKTQFKYKWCETKCNWIAFEEETNPTSKAEDGSQESNPYENEHYRWCTETNQWIAKSTAPTAGQTETEHYRWDAEKNEWILKSQISLDNVTYGYEDGVRTYTDKDGAVFFWETDKKAWFPKIDDDFMARYQMSYGFIDNTSVAVAAKEDEQKVEPLKVEESEKVDVPTGGVKRKAPPEPPKWFELDQTQNTKVYVSNLPLDITMDEFAEIMSKCGMIMRDPQTQKQKLKLYSEKDGQIKGDGLCDYIKVESVDLALKLLDESVVRGNKIRVQRAKFQMRGEYNPTLKPKRKKKDKEKLIKMKEKLFDWRPEKMRGERSKHEKIVIIKNLFTPELFDKEVQLIIDYQNDLREECTKCGTVRKVVIYDRHAEGVAQVNMADPDQADLVVQMMNGRFFGQRKLIAEIWDGKTKYKIAETEKEVKERISKWDKYLETEEEKAEKDKAHLTVSNTTEGTSDEIKGSVENVPSA